MIVATKYICPLCHLPLKNLGPKPTWISLSSDGLPTDSSNMKSEGLDCSHCFKSLLTFENGLSFIYGTDSVWREVKIERKVFSRERGQIIGDYILQE